MPGVGWAAIIEPRRRPAGALVNQNHNYSREEWMARYRVVERSQNQPARLVVLDEYQHRYTFDTWSGVFHDPVGNPFLEFYSDYGVWYPVDDPTWYSADELRSWRG